MITLENKKALVTGGTRGIGRGIVLLLADLGAKVAFTYASSSQKAEELVSEIEGKGRTAKAFQADVADLKQAQSILDELTKEWGGLDILVNNAGITRDNLLLRMSEEQWQEVLDTNLTGTFNYCKAAVKPMIRNRGGSIINISSVVGISGNGGQANYAATKAGLIGFSKSLAKELSSRNIRVNVIAPGYVDTELTGKLDEKIIETIKAETPLGRAGSVEEIARTVAFLGSGWSSYITGDVLRVDGGMAM